METCKECGAVFESTTSLHGHFRKHKLKIKSYYEKHYPKKCLQTSRKLVWKAGDSLINYLGRDFIDKTALNQYFEDSTEDKKETLIKILDNSYSRHDIVPSQIELASLPCSPTLLTYQKYFNLSELFEGKKTRFDYSINYSKSLPLKKIDSKDFMINIDTRESQEYRYYNSVRGKLDVGDYCLATDSSIVIERKSVADFGGTMVGGLERFRKEMERAKESGKYVILLCEYSIHNLHAHRFYGFANSSLVAHTMRGLVREYSDNMQVVFGGSRENCVQLVVQFLLLGLEARKYDLQLWVDFRKAQFHKNEFEEADFNMLYATT